MEDFLDRMTARRALYPDLHIYHYNHYEVTALKRLVGAHGTREEELDELLRGEVFVDLFKVVREALLIGQPSYSIKKIEAFYMEERETAVADGGDSVIEFERWLEEGDPAILAAIADYNEDDCVSTLLLRDWLLGLREPLDVVWFEPQERSEPSEKRLAAQEETEQLIGPLLAGVSDDPAKRSSEEETRWMMAQLLEYHHREERPVWWALIDRKKSEPSALIDDVECIAGLIRRPDDAAATGGQVDRDPPGFPRPGDEAARRVAGGRPARWREPGESRRARCRGRLARA